MTTSQTSDQRQIVSGAGWRVGWDPAAAHYPALVGTDDWSLELTAAELTDFRRLLSQLVDAIALIREELMDEEKIACEVESDRIWLEAEGYADAYDLHMIVLTGRRAEGCWQSQALPDFIQALQSLPSPELQSPQLP